MNTPTLLTQIHIDTQIHSMQYMQTLLTPSSSLTNTIYTRVKRLCVCVCVVQVFQFFISRVREKLHIVLCMSPVGDAFRSRCRLFPSLVNCCTIDWFVQVCVCVCLCPCQFTSVSNGVKV